MVLPRQLVGRGSPPTSPVALLLAFRNGAPSGPLLRVFALSLRDGATLPGRVCLSPRSDRRLLLHLPGVGFESSRWGHPVGSWFVPDLDRNEDLFGAPSLVVGVWPSRWGHPFWGRVALLCALVRNEGFLHSSILSCFTMGSPGGSSVWFSALDRNEAVFG